MHLPQEVVREGYIDKLNGLHNAVTITLLHPTATYEQIKKSLEVALKDIDIRISRGERNEESGRRWIFDRAISKDRKFPHRFINSRVLIETIKGRMLKVNIAEVRKTRFRFDSGKFIRFKNIRRIEYI